MNNFSLQQLQTVEKIVTEGSITKAAAQLYLTQPALSHQIRDLEKRLGLKLFDRVGKKLVPTEVCRQIVKTAHSVLPQIDELNRQMQIFKTGKNQVIRLSTECYTCYHWLPKIAQRFKENNRDIEVRIVVEATQQPLLFLERGELDVAIISSQPANKNLFVTALFEDKMVAVVPANHRFAQMSKPLKPEDFTDENFIYYNVPDNGNLILDNYFAGAKPRRIQKFQLTEAIIEMVAAEMGVSIMAEWAVKPYLKKQKIKVCPLAGENTAKTWFAATLSEQNQNLNHFVQAVKNRF